MVAINRSLNRPQLWQSFQETWQDLDWFLLFLTVGLTGLGGIVIRSVQSGETLEGYWWQHCFLGAIGVLIVLGIARWRYEHLLKFYWLVYGLTNLSLLAVRFIGTDALGAQRWIQVAGFNVQPSEFAKLGVIITLAGVLHRQAATTIPAMVQTLLIVGVPWVLVFLQPDLGTSLVFGAITLGMLYWGNVNPGWLVLLISPLISGILLGLGTMAIGDAAVTGWLGMSLRLNVFGGLWLAWAVMMGVIGWRTLPWSWHGGIAALAVNLISGPLGQLLWGLLRDYQKDRLILFLDPNKDPLGGGYHLIQSRIAIGSGQLWGQGIGQGTQTQLNFIPEQHTDFIFSAIGEELGFVGCFAVLICFWLICLRLLLLAQAAQDDFGSLLAVGVLSMLVFQVVVNVGMTIGLAPVTGIPLPWLSYGRSALLTNFIALGLVESVSTHSRSF